ncbi:uncharacterized protein EAE98_010746 [Botrytis deweyae]|uniref:Uncharacterized protein n=1 Tax=Botrytis deweyae TaxID=2478750 RepID=A0ABQ7I7X6_9HELO|nr:uncharacterized protein EAE98_010746 [Botrytis deweyae]KAF7916161.1 hypothetical protein EAE98_010746 [Botrytis deweyae]
MPEAEAVVEGITNVPLLHIVTTGILNARSRSITTARVTSKREKRPPISMDRYGANGGFPRSWSRSSRDGSIRAPSEASVATARHPHTKWQSYRGRASLNLHPRDPAREREREREREGERVAKWNEDVKRNTEEGILDGDPKTGLRSVNGEDHYREGSNVPSHDEYQQSHHSERPSQTSRPSYIPPPPELYASAFHPSGNRSPFHDLALQAYCNNYAPSSNRTHISHSRDSYAPSETPSQKPRNLPPPHRRGTYVGGHHNVGGNHNIGAVDLRQMQVNVTNIEPPDMSLINGSSRRERRKKRTRIEIEQG